MADSLESLSDDLKKCREDLLVLRQGVKLLCKIGIDLTEAVVSVQRGQVSAINEIHAILNKVGTDGK